MKIPSNGELFDALCGDSDLFEEVHNESDTGYRHGTYESTVFKRVEDNTYWSASYTLSGDGEEHGLREGYAGISQVWPVEVTTTNYTSVNPDLMES